MTRLQYSQILVDWLNTCEVGAQEIQIAVVQRLKCKIRYYEKQIDSLNKRVTDYDQKISILKNKASRTQLCIDYIQNLQPTENEAI